MKRKKLLFLLILCLPSIAWPTFIFGVACDNGEIEVKINRTNIEPQERVEIEVEARAFEVVRNFGGGRNLILEFGDGSSIGMGCSYAGGVGLGVSPYYVCGGVYEHQYLDEGIYTIHAYLDIWNPDIREWVRCEDYKAVTVEEIQQPPPPTPTPSPTLPAPSTTPWATSYPNPLEWENIFRFLDYFTRLLFFLGVAGFFFAILLCTYYIITAGGSRERVQKAKRIFIFSLIGFIIIIGARIIIWFIRNF